MTRRKTALATATALAAASVVAGAIAVPSAMAEPADGTAARQSDTATKGVRGAAARAAKEGVNWQECPADWGLKAPVQCGWVTVPVDYADPRGDTIKLAVSRLRSSGGKGEHQGSLLYNPGGPGGSGLDFPLGATDKDGVWAKTSRAYDFVGFDPRGVGHSAPISCVDPKEYAKSPKPDPVPDDEADKQAQRKLAQEYAEGCEERGGALLPHMTTKNTARDLDVIRAALGEKKLNYLGVSYGTYLGAVYAHLFPGHVRRMILDSVVNPAPEKIWYQANLDQDVAFEGRWNDWKNWVAEHNDAYGLGDSADDVQAAWDELRTTAKEKPLGGKVGPAELLSFFQKAAYADAVWPKVAAALSAYALGDEQPLVKAAAPDMSDAAKLASDENGNAVYTAVECNDTQWPGDWQQWDKDSERLHAEHPFMTWSNTWMNLPCANWPLQHDNKPLDIKPGKKLPATLILQAERDAATPYEGAVELHKRLKGSRLITEKDAGSHGTSGGTNSCINDRVDAYLLKGETGAEDTVCEPHELPEPEQAK
ncbi:alpha/beta hydrolase [Streptomyces sp. NA04227]|uniref:alpha/beta hydrolase n=1 Tax=Streptomyces sp. NA04227 TaxID=2742136 RepID=UPI0020CA9A29|nr:alpha/beta hydrolase [Streptomyces sp. NA04227]